MKRYLDLLTNTFMVRVLSPWSENIGNVVKTPKVYIADTGLLHALLDIPSGRALEAHPKVGASFEGFALQEVVRALHARPEQCYFWATHQGAELDLLVVPEGMRRMRSEHAMHPQQLEARGGAEHRQLLRASQARDPAGRLAR